jgi:hypothetical protein
MSDLAEPADAAAPAQQSTSEEPNSAISGTVNVPDAPVPVKPEVQKTAQTPAATPTQQAPPAEPAPGAPPADPDKWPRSAKEWDQFKQVRNENYKKRDERIAALEKDLADRETRLAGFANAVDPQEHSSVREERDKLSEALRLAAVEKHPRFQAYYDGKLGHQVEMAKRIVGPEQGEIMAALLKQPDSDYRNARIEELMSGLSPMAANRLGAVINAVDELRSERETEVARAREDYEKANVRLQSEQQQAQAAAKASAEKLFADTLQAAQAGGLPMLQLRDGDTAWNSAVNQRIAAAKNILFGQEKPEQLVRSALAAVSFPALLESHAALQAEHDKLVAQVAALRTATPTTSRATAPPAGGDHSTRQPAKLGSRPMQAAAEWIGLLNEQPAS